MESSNGEKLKTLSFIISMICFCTGAHAHDLNLQGLFIYNLTYQDIVQIKDANMTREAFENDWGQFELLIKKNRFPIPAPNCRNDIILRMPGVVPNALDREKQFDIRWNIFKSLLDLNERKIEQFEIVMSNKPYIKFDKDGKRHLQYCNVYFATNFSDWKKLKL
jgi:hypothetical protein